MKNPTTRRIQHIAELARRAEANISAASRTPSESMSMRFPFEAV